MRVRISRNGPSPERARSTQRWVGAALGCACMLCACGRTQSAVTEHAAPVRGVAPVKTLAPIATHSDHTRGDDYEPTLPSPAVANAQPAPSDAPAAPAADAQPEAPPKARDFPAELSRLVGDPSSCLEPRVSDGTLQPIQIAIRSQVMPSGAVGRAEISAPALRDTERRCITRRVELAHFAPPIEGAPLAVETAIWLRPTSAAPAPAPAAPTPAPQPSAAAAAEPPSADDAPSAPLLAATPILPQPEEREPTPPPSAAEPDDVAAAAAAPAHEDGTAAAE